MFNTASLMAFVATKDPARSRSFYEVTLGLRMVSDEQYAFVFDSNGIMLRIQKVQQFSPAAYTVLGWKVEDIHSEIASLVQRGVTFEEFPGLTQDKVGVLTFPDGTMVAWFKDPDGNILSLTQFSSSQE